MDTYRKINVEKWWSNPDFWLIHACNYEFWTVQYIASLLGRTSRLIHIILHAHVNIIPPSVPQSSNKYITYLILSIFHVTSQLSRKKTSRYTKIVELDFNSQLSSAAICKLAACIVDNDGILLLVKGHHTHNFSEYLWPINTNKLRLPIR